MPPMIQPVHSLLRPILPVASVRFNPLQGTIPKVLKLFIAGILQIPRSGCDEPHPLRLTQLMG